MGGSKTTAAEATGSKRGADAAGFQSSKKLKGQSKEQAEGPSEDSDEGSDEDEPLQLDIDNFGRPHGVTGTLDYSFRSLHSALRVPDEEKYVQLVQDCETAFTAREIENAEYSTGTTFFLPATMEPRCVLERMAREVFDFHTRDVKEYNRDKSGAEWWTLVLDAGKTNDDVAFHWDRDYGLEDQYRVNLHPHVGTVTYLSDIGGPTVVLEKISPVQTGSEECGAGEISTGYVSRPVLGKHISFDGRLLHGAPGDLSDVFSGATSSSPFKELQNGRRITFLVNVWLNHKPIDSDPFPEENLAKLTCSDQSKIKFDFAEAETAQEHGDGIQVGASDEAIKAGSKDAIKTLELSFIEASHKMSLWLPVPVIALQEAICKKPDASSFQVEFPSTNMARLVAGDEVEEEEEDDDGEDDGEDSEGEEDTDDDDEDDA